VLIKGTSRSRPQVIVTPLKFVRRTGKMRKLLFILLATFFVLGLCAQVSAAVTHFDNIGDVGFSGNETLIDFEDVVSDAQILNYYAADGVTFSDGLYGWLNFGFFPSTTENPNGLVGTNYLDVSEKWRNTKISFDPPVTHVGFDVWVDKNGGTSFVIAVYKDDTNVPSDTVIFPVPRDTGFFSVVDLEGIDHIVIGSPGHIYAIDNFRFESVASEPVFIDASVDIKPGNCMNPLNIRSRGVLPVAIHGAENLDVTQIDPATVLLVDVAPLRHAYEYVSDCTSDDPDDNLDLILKYDTQEIVKAIENSMGKELEEGDLVPFLNVSGNLKVEFGGTPIQGGDSVAIRAREKHKGHWKSKWENRGHKEHWKNKWENKEPKKDWKSKWENMWNKIRNMLKKKGKK
jgi:hypothetical protein